MLAHTAQRDVTGTVIIENAGAVAQACVAILQERYGDDAINAPLIAQAFEDVRAAYWGENPDWLPCDTPYHDLRHVLDTALAVARMTDGFEVAHNVGAGPALGPEESTVAVLLALMHDSGFLREPALAKVRGATLMRDHEDRSVRFARKYLSRTPLEHCADQAVLIQATNFSHDARSAAGDLPPQYLAIARILGSADLLAQLADRYYLEKCYHFLYAEFVASGLNRQRDEQGREKVLYGSPEELLQKTPDFYEQLFLRRLEQDFAHAYRYLELHFRGPDPYMAAVQGNIGYLRRLLTRHDLNGLRRRPRAVLPPAA